MISKDEMIPALLKALPELQAKWDSFLDEWANDPELPDTGLPLYLFLSEVARHLIRLLELGELEKLKLAFSVVESWHSEGDGYVKEAATVGLLEDIQNQNLHKSTVPKQFEPFLGPASKVGWNNLYKFWKDDS